METRCAVCRIVDAVVINIIIASPSDDAPDGCRLIEVMNGQWCDISATYNGIDFGSPPFEPDE